MRGYAVYGQFAANADADHHNAKLIDQRNGQHAAQIIFNHGGEERDNRHSEADINQRFETGKADDQHINRQLGGEGRQHNRTGGRGFGVSILQPAAQKRKACLNAESQQDTKTGRGGCVQRRDGEACPCAP